MISIDRLCYNSNLRYVNAGEKFAFAVLSLCACVLQRVDSVSCFVLVIMGILSVWKGGIPFSCYMRYMGVPLVFLLLSSLAIIINFSGEPLDLFAFSVGGIYITGSRESLFLRFESDPDCSCQCVLPVFSVFSYAHAGHPERFAPAALSETDSGADASDLPFHFCPVRGGSRYTCFPEFQAGEQELQDFYEIFWRYGLRSSDTGDEKSDALYNAMEARCYNGDIRVLDENFPPAGKEIILIVVLRSSFTDL